MKGVVFTLLLDRLEARHGVTAVEDLVEAAALPSGGAYTAVGDYDWRELQQLAIAYAGRSGRALEQVVREFGRLLFPALIERFPDVAARFRDPMTLMAQLDAVIHPLVRRIYPDAELPSFTATVDGGAARLVYRSQRALAPLAHGLLEGCLAHFGTGGSVMVEETDGGAVFVATVGEGACRTN